MAGNSWMIRHPNGLRSGRFPRSRQNNTEDQIQFDINKDPKQNVTIVLSALSKQSEISDGKRLNYLNAFVKLSLHIDGKFEQIGFSMPEIFKCLRIALVHESTQVRSGALRAIRHVVRHEADIVQLNALSIPFLVSRSLDLVLPHDVERIEAMKLARKILLLSPENFHLALGRSLVALANGGVEEKDRMLRICLATLCELGVVNPCLFMETGGVTAITRNLLECQTPKIAESLCGVLLLLLDRPGTRKQAAIDLHSIAAPYCDFHYRHGWKDRDKYVDERELRFNCSRLALLSILRSWPGILHFCSPSNKSGLKAIVQVLYLNQLEVRKAVLDLLYELLGLPQPEWTDELSVALSAIDPSEPQASWRLNEGFIAAEGRAILPHLAKTTPSITDMHLALLLYCFLECGLLGAIVEVMATSDTFISVRATVLLGELLHLIQVLLPPECCNISPALPSLLEYATQGRPQAVKAVNGLQQLQNLLRSRPASYSLHLDFILRSSANAKYSAKATKKTRKKTLKTLLQQWVINDGDDLIKESGVLLNKDAYTWNWNLIRIVLKNDNYPIDLNDASHRNFLKRLIDFYIPSMNRYSHMDLSSNKISLAYTMTGIELIYCLVKIGSDELLLELFSDINRQIMAITSGKSVHDCLFSPQHMNSTQCQSYFLFIGRLATLDKGVEILKSLDMFKHLHNLVMTTKNDCYVKLIVSSLDYGHEGETRELLKSVLVCPIESSRLYATQFLLVLLRAEIHQFYDWGIKLLVQQLNDASRPIYLTTLSILHEASESKECLETLVKLNPSVGHLGEKGDLLKTRYLSSAVGFSQANEGDFVAGEIKRWDECVNYRYIRLVEGETSDVLTLHQRDEDGKYDKRTSSVRSTSRRDFFLPPHLYGQLAQHADGSMLIIRHGSLDTMIKCIECALCETDDQILKLKASLWAIGQFGSTSDGLLYLILQNCLILIIKLAQECLVLSIRATSYYVLGLIASTRMGAEELLKLGWYSTRHNRHTIWPIIENEAWIDDDEDDYTYQNYGFSADFFLLDSGVKDVEESTDDDTSESIHVTDVSISSNQKSRTLPTGQNAPTSYHKRSLSESKTFEIIRAHVHKNKEKGSLRMNSELSRRIRQSSTTESNTSGVSSCDSGHGTAKPTIFERTQVILSPIPSSCSLSTMKQSGPKVRRYSESSKRSDRSSVSHKLTQQDLLGYATLRSLRKSPRYSEDSDDIRSAIFMNDSLSIDSPMSTSKRFSLNEHLDDGQCYMGICLPRDICNIFMDDGDHTEGESISENGKSFTLEEEIASTVQELKLREEIVFEHDQSVCFNCLSAPRDAKATFASSTDYFTDSFQLSDQNCPDSVMRGQVLRLVDQFSNPVWCKQVKQSLLLCKQKSPQIFHDACMYSEVCKMMAASTYRLSPRRMLHELFLEVAYTNFYKECVKMADFGSDTDRDERAANESEMDASMGAGGDTQTSMKKLDTLKLAYKENKFPIRHRKVEIH